MDNNETNQEIIINLGVNVTMEELNLITEGYQFKDSSTAKEQLYFICRDAIEKKLSKVGRCMCGRVYGKTDKKQKFCSRVCAEKYREVCD